MKIGDLIRLRRRLESGRNISTIVLSPRGVRGQRLGDYDIIGRMREGDVGLVIEVPERYSGDDDFGPDDETAFIKIVLTNGITGWVEGWDVERLT